MKNSIDPASLLLTQSDVLDRLSKGLFHSIAPHESLQSYQNSDFIHHDFVDYHAIQKIGQQSIACDFGVEHSENFYDFCALRIPKSMDEARGILANLYMCLKQDGILIAAGMNLDGGNRLKSLFTDMGLHNIQSQSRAKGRVVWGYKTLDTTSFPAFDPWFAFSQYAIHPAHGYITRAGLYGWNQIDRGSQGLIQWIIDQKLSFIGNGADFGCGYGYLSGSLYKAGLLKDTQRIDAFDCDARAVEAFIKSLAQYSDPTHIHPKWDDITQLGREYDRHYDWIIMNPPFHQNKQENINLGRCFIEKAAHCLKPKGRLLMVMNDHLPYRETLNLLFSKNSMQIHADKGFQYLLLSKT